MNMVREVDISEIEIGERTREDIRDIQSLAESIKRLGLLNPITVRRNDPGFELLAGYRRLEACKFLGWDSILAQVLEEGEDAWRPK